MDTFTERDAYILDSILLSLVENNKLTKKDLQKILELESFLNSDFQFYFNLLSQHRLINGIISNDEIDEINLEPQKIKTHNFVASGGFKNILRENNRIKVRNDEIDRLSLIKLRSETRITKWQKLTYWPLFIIGVLAFSYSTYDLINKKNYNKPSESEIKKIQALQEELVKIKTLISNNTGQSFLSDSTDINHSKSNPSFKKPK